MEPIAISKRTARRFVLGRQGLWPGRRWAGKAGTAAALRAVEDVQMDPLNVVARSHDLVLWSRVIDYRPEYLDELLYQDREFFDYGGGLSVYPMTDLPYRRLEMRRKAAEPRWLQFAAENPALLAQMRAAIRERGPLGNRDFEGGARVNSYRGRKDTALALYYLWLTGELMIHHRERFERVYDLRERVAPPHLDYAADEDEARRFMVLKSIAWRGLVEERLWRAIQNQVMEQRLSRAEAWSRAEALIDEGTLIGLRVEGSKEGWLALAGDLPVLQAVEAGEVPTAWQPLDTTTDEEAVFLAPLDIVHTRGRSAWLFDFEYVWEVYKPAEQRRWGYYTLPILYGDRLVARLDPKLERASSTLAVKGFWLEEHAPAADPAFALALARGLRRLAAFIGAERMDLAAIEPAPLRAAISETPSDRLETVGMGECKIRTT